MHSECIVPLREGGCGWLVLLVALASFPPAFLLPKGDQIDKGAANNRPSPSGHGGRPHNKHDDPRLLVGVLHARVAPWTSASRCRVFFKADIRPQFVLFAWSIQSLPLSPASPRNTPPAPPACHGVYGGVPRRGGGERRVRVIANVVCVVRLVATESFRGLGSRGLAPSTPFTARLARPRATTRVRDMQRAPASGRRPKDYGFLCLPQNWRLPWSFVQRARRKGGLLASGGVTKLAPCLDSATRTLKGWNTA